MMRVFVALFILFCCAVPQKVHAQSIRLEPATDHIDITTGFDGAEISIFGVAGPAEDVILVVTGPERRMVVRKKEKMLGAWVHRNAIAFDSVPGFYRYGVSDKTLEQSASDVFAQNSIGLDMLDFQANEKGEAQEYYAAFREALIRNKQSEGTFPLYAEPITFLQDGFFKVDFRLPSNVPKGRYIITGYALRNGQIQSVTQSGFQVIQVGFSATLFNFAYSNALAYGLVSVMIAFIAGWSAFAFLRRD